MTTDLRAALREALNLSQHQDFDARHAAYMRLVEISIAPPTVAELLTALPEPPGSRGPGAHRVEWSHDDMRFRAWRHGIAGLIVEADSDGQWTLTHLNHADFAQPATLVEVVP